MLEGDLWWTKLNVYVSEALFTAGKKGPFNQFASFPAYLPNGRLYLMGGYEHFIRLPLGILPTVQP
jgi:hypothetical protein